MSLVGGAKRRRGGGKYPPLRALDGTSPARHLRGSALALDYNHGVAETSPFREPRGADVREVEATRVRAGTGQAAGRGRAGRALPRARHPAGAGSGARPDVTAAVSPEETWSRFPGPWWRRRSRLRSGERIDRDSRGGDSGFRGQPRLDSRLGLPGPAWFIYGGRGVTYPCPRAPAQWLGLSRTPGRPSAGGRPEGLIRVPPLKGPFLEAVRACHVAPLGVRGVQPRGRGTGATVGRPPHGREAFGWGSRTQKLVLRGPILVLARWGR